MTDLRIGPLDDLDDGRGRRIDVDDVRLAVFRVDDEVYAIGDRCSHAEASLAEGEVFDGEVECPRHGAAFDLVTGSPLSLPATKPVPTYPARVIDGDVVVTLIASDESEGEG
ncbi:MAG: non-heme iron oxygenase ferredoxin subunit [Acidimicrobiia bacterium]|nr:non-heme iron oxygenase ferredoxin subunit [Acidimicrobiia bacterium]